MLTKNNTRTSLLTYWTTRYLISLCIGLLLLGAGSFWWIRHTTIENRLNLLEYLADETADQVSQSSGGNEFDAFDRRFDNRSRVLNMERPPLLIITDLKGNEIGRGGGRGLRDDNRPGAFQVKLPAEIFANSDSVQKLNPNGTALYAVKAPIKDNSVQTGWVVVMQDEAELAKVNQEYRLLIILLVGLGLLGWLVIYFLSKKIVKPIQEVAHAAASMKDGNYDVKLNSAVKEQEIYDLVTSFQEMTQRLTQLEKLRAELLAGVTHDLKTPVTSISGLIQAVRDGIVTGDERQEFLDITLKEIGRLQNMIADLLDFNSLSAGAFTIHPETCNMNELIHTIIREWRVTQQSEVQCTVSAPEEIIYRETDPLRLQQILINLLNNAAQAMNGKGSIIVSLSESGIDIADTGTGIPEKEQPYIFERFFRGEKKKLKVRGLGLGLPFSRMLAKALGGDLVLRKTSPAGSMFSIIWNNK
ncbi:HAMP domain-containing sensor histidine kinase [Metabacillus sp. RGM 3146]|uniref:HAMP domain-containing sensor histidine kinase n=1 Tax=Metabacillus sp. RGM 3146 TaxID=3401092 RepID=UPI003B99EDAC